MSHVPADAKPGSYFVLTLSCPNKVGIVFSVAKFLLDQGCNITESDQFDDQSSGRFFMRVAFSPVDGKRKLEDLTETFADIATPFEMDWRLTDMAIRPRVLICVSKFDHCLADLLYRWNIGELRIDIPAVVSNHRDSYRLCASHDIPYHHLAMVKGKKAEQEEKLLDIIRDSGADLVVLARYMQILSDDLCSSLPCPAINIHHSFLPSFKGAKPYHQAHAKGVKLIGATAHYVTPDLDEGPIIWQDVAPVTHAMSAEDFVARGRDVEKVVLANAVRHHIERRVLRTDNKTVVFT